MRMKRKKAIYRALNLMTLGYAARTVASYFGIDVLISKTAACYAMIFFLVFPVALALYSYGQLWLLCNEQYPHDEEMEPVNVFLSPATPELSLWRANFVRGILLAIFIGTFTVSRLFL